MSQAEIDRILNADFSDIDGAVEAKISSIDQMASKLNQRSNFLAQFQSLLQNQLGNVTNTLEKKQVEKGGNEDKVKQATNIKTKQIHQFTQTNFPPLIQQIKECQCFSKVDKIRFDLQEYKVHFVCLKQEISNQIKHYQSAMIQLISQGINYFFKQQKQAYQHTIEALKIEITKMTEEKTKRKNQISPLRQITFNRINAEMTASYNITKRLSEYDSSQAKHPKGQRKDEINEIITNSIEKNGKKGKKDQIQNSFVDGLFKEDVIFQDGFSQRKKQYDLPSVRPLTVGIPPLKDGFGMLKQGNCVIYRGQWRNGRFEGSGKLIWDGYSYEGGFKNGLFEGHGTLSYNGITFMGKFVSNKACGEGTLIFPSGKIMGFWSENNCLRLL